MSASRTSLRPDIERAVVWSAAATPFLPDRPRLVWDLAAVHALLHGDRRRDPAAVWAGAFGLAPPPVAEPHLTLLDAALDPVEPYAGPVRPDGSLHPEAARFASDQEWAALAQRVQHAQEGALRALPDARADPVGPPLPLATAWSESAASVLCTELAAEGLPIDRGAAQALIVGVVGDGDRATRDRPVLAALDGDLLDLRSPAQVLDALHRRGIAVPDTRSWRLEPFRITDRFVDALLVWRKAERLATTYGRPWLDAHLGADGRLRGPWTAADGGAGRMTAGAGLHSFPAELRSAVRAEPGHLLVRADLGQVEPRVLAAVSGDQAFARAAAADDLYTPVAAHLGCDRPTAKIAVLAAMYGQTSGAAGQALLQMERAYPKALTYLRTAEEAGRVGRDVRTHGGRLVRSGSGGAGRFVRNAVIQGAAAELFKAWAAAVRNQLLDGRIVLCLHDELLLHVPVDQAEDAVHVLHQALSTVTGHWAAGSGVRFVADVAVGQRWSDAR